MTRYTLLGVLACVGGGLLLGFQTISGVMGTKAAWKSLSVADVVGREHFARLASVAPEGIEAATAYLAAMPLYVLLFCLGGLLFISDYFLGRR